MSVIEKLRRSAQSERELGNMRAAAAFDAKADAMQNKSGGLVPVKLDDITAERRRVEILWEKIPPDTRVVLLCIESGLSRTVRREMPMSEAIILLKAEKARLLGRADAEWVLPPQQTTENCAPLNTAPTNKQLFI